MEKFVFIVLVIVGLWVYSDSLPFQSEVTVYNAFCKDGLKQGECPSNEETSNRTFYKPLVDQQTVLYWWEGNEVIKRYRNCAVRNVHNWSCQSGGSQEVPDIEYQMVDGNYSANYHLPVDSPPRGLDREFYTVSKWHWWWIWFKTRTTG